jgi:hypothetical protein
MGFQTVNEIIYGSKIHERTVDEQKDAMNVFRSQMQDSPRIEAITDRAATYKIHNFGKESATELAGLLGIWLSQFGDRVIDGVELERKRRAILRDAL